MAIQGFSKRYFSTVHDLSSVTIGLSSMVVGRVSVAATRKQNKCTTPSKTHQNDHFARANDSSDGEKDRSKQSSLHSGLSQAEKLMMPPADSRIHSGLLEKKVTFLRHYVAVSKFSVIRFLSQLEYEEQLNVGLH